MFLMILFFLKETNFDAEVFKSFFFFFKGCLVLFKYLSIPLKHQVIIRRNLLRVARDFKPKIS